MGNLTYVHQETRNDSTVEFGVCYFQTHPQCQMSNMRNGLARRFDDANVKKWFESSNRRAGQCLLHGRSPLCQGAPAKCCHCWGMVSPIFTVETMLGQSSSLHNLCWNRSLTDRAKQHCIGRLDKTQKQSLKHLNLNMILAIYPIHVPLISSSSSTLRVLETTQQWTNLPCSSTAEISLDPDRSFCHQDQNRVFNMFKLSYAWETLILAPTGSPFFVQNIDTPNRSLHSLRLELPGHCRGTHHRPSGVSKKSIWKWNIHWYRLIYW